MRATPIPRVSQRPIAAATADHADKAGTPSRTKPGQRGLQRAGARQVAWAHSAEPTAVPPRRGRASVSWTRSLAPVPVITAEDFWSEVSPGFGSVASTLSPTLISEMGLFHPPAMRTVAPGTTLDPPDVLAQVIEVADHERNAVARAGGDAVVDGACVRLGAAAADHDRRNARVDDPAGRLPAQGLQVQVKAVFIVPGEEGTFTLRPSSHRTRAKRRG